jgi:SsrA-binding protein
MTSGGTGPLAPSRNPETDRAREKGLTLVPPLVFKNGGSRSVALVKGKQEHDKRETIRRREVDRETRAAIKSRGR